MKSITAESRDPLKPRVSFTSSEKYKKNHPNHDSNAKIELNSNMFFPDEAESIIKEIREAKKIADCIDENWRRL